MNTKLYPEWIKNCTYSDDLVFVNTEEDSSFARRNINLNESSYNQLSSIIELNINFDTPLKLTFLKQARDVSENYEGFEISFETVQFNHNLIRHECSELSIAIIIKGEMISSTKTKLDMLYKVCHTTSIFKKNLTDQLQRWLSESLSGISIFITEKMLKHNLLLLNKLFGLKI